MFGWRIIRIDGESMAPLLRNGDFAAVRMLRRTRPLRTGDMVLVDHAMFGQIVKCLGTQNAEGFDLYGLSRHSTSRASLGRVERSRILGRLCWRIFPGGIIRLAPSAQPQNRTEEIACLSP